MENWVIRKYMEGDEEKIINLVNIAFNVEIDKKYWNWKYKENPTKLIKIWVVENRRELIGHMSFIPMIMKIEGKTQIGALQSSDAVHPKYQGQGIYTKLCKQVHPEIKEITAINFDCPSERGYPFAIKFGYFKVCSLPRLFKPLDLERILQRHLRNVYLIKIISTFFTLFLKIFYATNKFNYTSIKGINIRKISSFDNRFNDFWKKVSKNYKIIVVKDKEYLTWRYIDKPSNNYTVYSAEEEDEILGYIVLESVKTEYLKGGRIMDILTLTGREDVIQSLILKAIAHFKEENADIIHCCISKNNIYYDILKKNGFIPLFFVKKPRLVARANTTEISKSFLINPKNWFITSGDLMIYE